MNWNILILAGFVLRIAYAIANENYHFTFLTREGRRNIKKKIVSFIFALTAWYLSFFYHADDKITDGWALIVLWGVYITVGWAIDSLWLAFVTFIEQKIKKELE
jgi:hypothetical protein